MFLEIKVLEKENLIFRLWGPRPLSSSSAYSLIVKQSTLLHFYHCLPLKMAQRLFGSIGFTKNYTVVAKKGKKPNKTKSLAI